MATIGQDFPHGFEVLIPCLLEGAGMIDAVDCSAMGGRIIMYGCIGTCVKPFDWLEGAPPSPEHRRHRAPSRHRHAALFQRGVNMVEQGLVNGGR